MSYILDALKKAEADRDPEARASLAMAQHDRRRSRLLTYGVLIALIVNAVVLLWLFLPEPWFSPASETENSPAPSQPEADTPAAQGDTQSLHSNPLPAGNPAPTSTSAPAPAPATDVTDVTATSEPVSRAADRRAPSAAPVALKNLPADVRRRFPTLEFSTHIYADAPDLRAVVVNGIRLEEGDRLENLWVHEITEEGAVFSFEDRLVSVSVLDAWN